MADPTAPKQPWGDPFKLGRSGNPAGRPKGSRNKLGEAFPEDMLADWEANGPAANRKVRVEKPDAYKVVASILPRDLPHQIDKLQPFVEAFTYRYNHHRPHDAVDGLTPAEYLRTFSGAPPKPSHMSSTRTSDRASTSCGMTLGELTVPEWLRRSQAIVWVTLLGMLFHMAFAFGHIDGPTHRDGFLLASFERLLAGPGEEPASGHHDNNSQGHCDICIIGSMGAARPAPSAVHVLSELSFYTINWVATAARRDTLDPASHHEIRGPP
jgi:hypothetical protein